MHEQDNGHPKSIEATVDPVDEGGLRAPPGLTGWRKAWWWFDFIILVKLARLRFIGVLLVIGVIITQWDRVTAYYEKWTRGSDASVAAGGGFEWFCPMHPSIVRDNPKDKCPVCFMPLSKRKQGETSEEVLPAGIVNRVQLSPYRVVLAGVRTWKLDYQPVFKEIKAAGFIEFNERGQRTVSARIAGRIDTLFVNETGKMVRVGDQLASLYSPDLVVTVQNLLDAKHGGNSKNQESAQKRLELLGIDGAQIAEILAADKAGTNLAIRSPISGHIIKKYVREGQYVEQGTPLYDVADLSTVWIQAQVYEDDMEFLPVDQDHSDSPGQHELIDITATTRAFAKQIFHGKLSFVFPHVDQNTRTVTIRCEIENPGHKLKPGSTATVTLKMLPKNLAELMSATAKDAEQSSRLAQGEVLAVPETAVIDTGAQTIVYRETIPGTFEGVRVELGPRMSGPEGELLYPVLSGLARGERVVASGSFLVDAETRLNPAVGSVYFGGSGGSKSAQSSVTTVRPSTPEDEKAKLAAVFAQMTPADRRVAEAQQFCPVLEESRLGSMGPPVKVTIEGQVVFLCCKGCKKGALANPQKTLAKITKLVGQKHRPTASTTVASADDESDKAEAEIKSELAKLPDLDRQAATSQRFCVVLDNSRLGSMGAPEKLVIDGQTLFVCCEGCKEEALADPQKTLARLALIKEGETSASSGEIATSSAENETEEAEVAAALAELPDNDRALASAQRDCAVLDNRLGSMGMPVKVMIDGKPVFLCCEGCRKKAMANAKAALSKAARLNGEAATR
jgi:Cu(I)/Ag(I) efflux system membrane fusion protein